MKREELVALITQSVRDFSAATGKGLARALDEATPLFGPNALLDSMELVNVVLDVEQQVNDKLATAISLADERAMSQKSSPFRTIGTLADYVLGTIGKGS